MVDYKNYKDVALEHGVCSEYIDIWNNCKSKRQIMNMCLSAKGIDYVCDSIAKGWGLSPESFCENFEPFMNGRYVRDESGYTSKVYCRYMGRISADTTLMALIDCEAKIDVPKNNICEIYCVGNCLLDVRGEGEAVFVCYGDEDSVKISGSCKNMKRINKKDRD